MNQRQGKDTLFGFDEQVYRSMVGVLKEHLPLSIRARKLDEDRLWGILLYASLRRTTIETACRALSEAPSGNRLREHLAEQLSFESIESLEDRLNEVLHAGLPKKIRHQLARSKWEVAGDWVDIPYYGRAEEGDAAVRRSAPRSGSSRFYSFATLTVINYRRRCTIALTLVRNGETMAEVVKRLMGRMRALGLRCKLSLWDKAFGTVEVMRYLRRQQVPHIIALARRGAAGGISQLCKQRRGRLLSYQMRSSKAGKLRITVAVCCKYSKSRYRRPGVRYFCYAVYRVRLMKPRQISEKYRRRFAIESSYRQMHEVRARTAMRNVLVRLLLVALALFLVNAYVLMRQIIQRISTYGSRQGHLPLTLGSLILMLEEYISRILGRKQALYCRNFPQYVSFVIY